MVKLILPVSPSVNHYKHYFCTRSSRNDPHKVSATLTPRAKQYKHDVGWEAKQMGVQMLEAGVAVALVIDAYQQENKPRLDADNILKVVLDALNGIAWEDDKQVQDIHIRNHFVKKEPHLQVVIEPIEGGEDDGIRQNKPGTLASAKS